MNYKLITLLNKNKDISKELECMTYPFNNISNKHFRRMYKQTPFRNNNKQYSIDFPTTIKDLYYLEGGQLWDDQQAYVLIGKLNSGKYFYYIAKCCYTGFGCSGGSKMELYIEDTLEDLIDYCVDEYIRNSFTDYYEHTILIYNHLQSKICKDLCNTIYKYNDTIQFVDEDNLGRIEYHSSSSDTSEYESE